MVKSRRFGWLLSNISQLWRTRIIIEPTFSGIGISLSIPKLKSDIEDRLAKIDLAKANLSEALSAIEEIKLEAYENRKELSAAQEAINKIHVEKLASKKELDEIKKINEIDTIILKNNLGIPSKIQQYLQIIIGFILGITASVIASVVWVYIGKYFQ